MICALMTFNHYERQGIVQVDDTDVEPFRWLCDAVGKDTYAGGNKFGPVFDVARFIDGHFSSPWLIFTDEFAPDGWLRRAPLERLWWLHGQLRGRGHDRLLGEVDAELRDRSERA